MAFMELECNVHWYRNLTKLLLLFGYVCVCTKHIHTHQYTKFNTIEKIDRISIKIRQITIKYKMHNDNNNMYEWIGHWIIFWITNYFFSCFTNQVKLVIWKFPPFISIILSLLCCWSYIEILFQFFYVVWKWTKKKHTPIITITTNINSIWLLDFQSLVFKHFGFFSSSSSFACKCLCFCF